MADFVGGSVVWTLDVERGTFGADLSSAANEVKGLSGQFQKSAKQIGGNLQSIGKGITAGITLPILGFGILSAKEFGQFNASIQRAGAFVDATSEQMDAFKESAIDAARGTSFSFTEVADALGAFVGGEVSAEEATESLGDVIDLALVAKMDDLQSSVNLAELALTVFKDDAMDVSDVIDVLGTVAADVTTETDAWSNAIVNSAGAAKSAGFSFKELNVLFAAMKRGGADVNLMWSAFNSAMVNIQSPTDSVIAGLESVNLTIEDLQKALSAGPIELLEFLKQGFDKANESGKGFAFLTDVIGRQAAPEFALALGLTNEEIRETAGLFDDIGGRGAVMVEKIREAIPAIDRIRQSFNEIAVAAGPAVSVIFEKIASGLAVVTQWFTNLSPRAQELVLIFLLAIAAIGPVILILGSLAAAIAFLATPIGVITIAIAGLVALFAVWVAGIIADWDNIKKQFITGKDTIVTFVIQPLMMWFGLLFDFWNLNFDSIGAKWDKLVGKFKSGVEGLKEVFSGEGSFSDIFLGERAQGGPVSAGGAYLVGEEGPELFVPGTSGTIIPNGAGGNTFNFNISEKVDLRYAIEMVKRELGTDSQAANFGISR